MALPQPLATIHTELPGFDATRFEALGAVLCSHGATAVRLVHRANPVCVFPQNAQPIGPHVDITTNGPIALEVYGLNGAPNTPRDIILGQIYLDSVISAAQLETVTSALVASRDQLGALFEVAQAVRRTVKPDDLLTLLTYESMRLMHIDHAFSIFQAPGEPLMVDQSPGTSIADSHIQAMIVSSRRTRSGRVYQGIHSMPDGVYNVALIPVPVRKQVFAALGLMKRAGDNPKAPGSEISLDDIRLGEAIADQIGAQLDSALLFKDAVAQAQLETEMTLARRVQNGLISNKIVEIDGVETYASSIPALQVGGDYFDFIHRPDGQLVFVLGDVTGKGMPAALTMIMTRTIVRSNALHMPLTRPDQLASRVNKDLYDHLSNVSMFSTMFIGMYNPADTTLQYTSAGHSPVYFVPADGDPVLIEARDVPLGVLDSYEFASDTLAIRPGDSLVVATDGYNESRSQQGEMFGYERMADTLKSLARESAAGIAQGLLQAVSAFSEDHPQDDDRTILIFRIMDQYDG